MICFNAAGGAAHQGDMRVEGSDRIGRAVGPGGLGALALALALWLPVPARAQEAVVLWLSSASDRAEQASALAVELAPRNAGVLAQPWPPGGSPGVRATAARTRARGQGADAALWMEREADGSVSVRAVAADTELTAWAPVPSGARDPRVVALIAVSLLDELLAEPAPAGVTVRFRIPAGRRLSRPDADPFEASGVSAPPRLALAAPPVEAPRQRRDFYLEIGPTFAGVAGGLGVGAGFYPDKWVRLSLHARATYVFIAEIMGSAFTASGAFITDDDDARFEAGVETGLILTDDGRNGVLPGHLMGAFIGFSWAPWEDGRIGFRVNGAAAFLEGSFTPSGILDLYMQVMP